MAITVELFGVPRLRVGLGQAPVVASTLAEALRVVGRSVPALEGSVVRDGALAAAYRVSINGDRFLSDPADALAEGDVLILLTADAGG